MMKMAKAGLEKLSSSNLDFMPTATDCSLTAEIMMLPPNVLSTLISRDFARQCGIFQRNAGRQKGRGIRPLSIIMRR